MYLIVSYIHLFKDYSANQRLPVLDDAFVVTADDVLIHRNLVGGTVLTLVVLLSCIISTVVLDIVVNVLFIFTVECLFWIIVPPSFRVPLDCRNVVSVEVLDVVLLVFTCLSYVYVIIDACINVLSLVMVVVPCVFVLPSSLAKDDEVNNVVSVVLMVVTWVYTLVLTSVPAIKDQCINFVK